MSHPGCECAWIRYHRRMPRSAVATVAGLALASLAALGAALGAAACSKSKDAPVAAPAADSTGETIAPPPGERVPPPGVPASLTGAGAVAAPAGGAPAADSAFRLKPEEGQISIELPEGAKAGTETVAKVVVTPGPKFKINFEFPTKLTLAKPEGVALAKTELKAGGPDQSKGDAEKFEERQLAFAVKLTPTAAGTHTVSGNFKFAVCDKDQCLAKREAIAIQVAAQ